ncbi:diguanylate cyclase domain-containing protein [Sporomusa aerivorans]|uniref:sensor domain-containing diguanylate cyclase n=1 Tax=Sporomusa aerivorans TaxID=204936 RepID=UPI00352B4EEA
MNNRAGEIMEAELAACQARLADCEAKLAGLINNPNDFIWAIDSHYRLTVMNDNFQDTYRSTYQVELVPGDSVLEIVHPHMSGQWRSLYTRALAGERIVEQHVMGEGERKQFFDVFLHPIKQENRVTGAAVFVRDITAKKQMERQVHQLNQMYEMIIENANVWITVQDCDGCFVIWNQGAEAISGYLQEEVCGNRQIAEKLYPDEEYRLYVERQMNNVRNGHVLDNLYLSVRNKEGEQRILAVNARRIVDETGKCDGISQIAFDITEHDQREKELTSYANTDSLTGVLNRRTGLDALRRMLQIAVQDKTPMCVCYADMNGLKKINDTYGHQEGDAAIMTVANTIIETIRQSDIVCRLGGDEFLMVLGNCTAQSARRVREEIGRRLAAYGQMRGKPYFVSASIGICEYNPVLDETCCAEELLARADRDMYQEKWASVNL